MKAARTLRVVAPRRQSPKRHARESVLARAARSPSVAPASAAPMPPPPPRPRLSLLPPLRRAPSATPHRASRPLRFFPFASVLALVAVSGLVGQPAAPAAASAASTASAAPDFAREIQPLLAGRCYDCHGPEQPKGGLALTTRANLLRGGKSGLPAVIPGDAPASELLARIASPHDDEVMPQKGARLTPGEISLLRRWIETGAVWPDNLRHWAYEKPIRPAVPAAAAAASTAPARPPLPAIENKNSKVETPLDAFIAARLARDGLVLSPPADKPRWLRRVSLDLIGLPPTPAELADFLADASPAAHARVVDRLLASPHYGERWARPWLDLARYADSHGFQRDDLRESWPYRDWVVRALNADLPFDRFSILQLAGDLVPDAELPALTTPLLPPGADLAAARTSALVATGFHRAAPTNVEAGTDQEEGRVNQVFDRVNTTGAVWLGTTLECAQCHNHKYDPFSQTDYYRLFAYFNHTAQETAFASAKAQATLKFTGPFVDVAAPADTAARAAALARQAELDARLAALAAAPSPAFDAWAADAAASLATAAAVHPLDVAEFSATGESNHRILPDRSVLLVDDAPDRDTYIVTVRTALTGITGFKLEVLVDPSLPGTGPGRGDAARPNFVLNNFRVTAAAGDAPAAPVAFVRATASFSQNTFPVSNLLRTDNTARGGWAINPQFKRDHWALFETAAPLGDARGATFTFTLEQNFGSARTIGRFRLSAVTGRLDGTALPADVAAALRVPADRRTAKQTATLRAHFVAQDPAARALKAEREKIAEDLARRRAPQALVMSELPAPRATHILKRGNFLDPGEPVSPGTPAALHPLDPALPPNRLGLARWLVSSENPLVARVVVNRWWAEFFGRGLVATPEDFGLKGEPPTHPELLDWLAVEFMASGWSGKHVHRLIALSAVYRQSSRVTPALLAHDDQNKWLARGPRFRLDAEAIRDNALAIAGLLSPKLGGPPVRPYQPPGLWESKVGGDRVTYDVSTGEDAYRRGLYTVWKRASPYPSFMNFDATARTACTVRRSRTNTPLQALTLLNDPVYVEAARALARRVLAERADSPLDARLRHAFQLCLTRPPTEVELASLRRLHADRTAAGRDEATVWHDLATALLNLDETITKG